MRGGGWKKQGTVRLVRFVSLLSFIYTSGLLSLCTYVRTQVFGGDDSDDEELPPSGLSARQVGLPVL